jgi:signal transduction histidine kinase
MAAEPAPLARPGLRASGIRVRTTALAVVAVGLALVAAATAMAVLLDRSLREQVRASATARALAIAGDPNTASDPALLGGDREEEFVQILDADGAVLASSPNVAGRPALVEIRPGETRVVEGLPVETGPFLVVAVRDGAGTVLVGRSIEDTQDVVRGVVVALAIGIPLLVLLVAAVTWRVVGRALAPVEAIRAEVEAISTDELHRRVPDPPGHDEIARLAATMNRMLERLEEGQARQRRFVSDASHELRSPVASIRQHAEVALRHPEGTDLRSLAEVAHDESLRLQRIVEDLLLLTRIDEGTLRMRRDAVDLDDLVQDEAARLRASTDLRIETDRVNRERVLGDRERLERLLRNLGDNATRHARGRISLSLSVDDGGVVLAVEDDGPGIPRAERDRVFDRFVRLEPSRERDSGGSGLGLSIVREIAALHGGTATVGESPLGGARFEVRLPAGG